MIDTYKPNMEDLHRLIVQFTAEHVEGQLDYIGPNKPDAPFFNRMARRIHDGDGIEPMDLVECAERLHKYRLTQLPLIGSLAGYPPNTDWGVALDVLRAIGEEAKRIQREYRKKAEAMFSVEKTLYEDGFPWAQWHVKVIDVPEFTKLAQFANDNPDKFPPDWGVNMLLKQQEMARVMNEALKTDAENRTFQAERYVRKYNYKGYDREDKRIRLTLPVSRDQFFHNTAKEVCGFPDYMWDWDYSCWSLKDTKEAIDKLVRGFNLLKLEIPYNFDALLKLRGESADPIVEDESTYYNATLHKGDVMVKIPYKDSALRKKVKDFGAKWNKDAKSWVIPMSKIALVHEAIEDDYPVLHKNIEAIPEVHTYLKQKAERVAISDVATLGDDDPRVKEMEARLSEVFPPGHKLYPFQYVGVRFAELALGRALIGDDMGLGKTMQALAYVALHPEHHPALVVCPSIVKYNWLNETQKWLGSTYTSGIIDKGSSPVPDTDIVVINYDIVNKKKDELLERGFKTIVCDESHYLKNYKAARTKATLEIVKECESVLFLSGTAATNRPVELWTTLNALRPTEWRGKWYEFTNRYCGAEETRFGRDVSGSSNEKELHGVLRELMIRRLKKEVLPELPDKVREYVQVNVSDAELRKYKRLSETLWLEAKSGKPGAVLNMLTELRHECGRMKTKFTAKYVADYVEQTGGPVVVFAHHKDVLREIYDIVREMKKEDGGRFRLRAITGETPAERRTEIVERFQDGAVDMLLASTTAANTGITLTRADTVFFVERDWTPAVEEQAEDRVNRIGQDSGTVWAKYLTLRGTIDETFNEVVEGKRAVIKAFLDGGDKQERYNVGEELIKAMVAKGELPAEAIELHAKDKKKPKGYE